MMNVFICLFLDIIAIQINVHHDFASISFSFTFLCRINDKTIDINFSKQSFHDIDNDLNMNQSIKNYSNKNIFKYSYGRQYGGSPLVKTLD